MFWQEDNAEVAFQVPDDIVDLLFSIDCRRLPVDHAHALSAALRQAAPALAADGSNVAVHTIHVAGSQNGWARPEHGTDQHLIVSKRTKLTLRVPKARMDAIREGLEGRTLDVSGCPLTIRSAKVRPLSKAMTLFARYVVSLAEGTAELHPSDARETVRDPAPAGTEPNPLSPHDAEGKFLHWAVQELNAQGIRVRKALCGKTTPLSTPSGMLHTRSLMLADLSPEESVRLQQIGLGPHREMGCGIFIPHKGIEALGKPA